MKRHDVHGIMILISCTILTLKASFLVSGSSAERRHYPPSQDRSSSEMIEISLCDSVLFLGTRDVDTMFICVTGLGQIKDEIIAYQTRLVFDKDVLSVIGVTNENTISDWWGPPIANTRVPGEVIVGGYGVASLIGAGSLVGIIFQLSSSARSRTELHFENFIFNRGTPAVTIKDSSTILLIK